MTLIFATNNKNKLIEVQNLIPSHITLVDLQSIGCDEDIPEDGKTLEENALFKAQYISEKYNMNCFADDTGLEVETLNNAPGVYSARYAGTQRNSEDNMKKLLLELDKKSNRNAQFKTIITLILNDKITQFKGITKGTIAKELNGKDGFGYDPIFVPEGCTKTFAEMSLEDKNRISHRGKAIKQLVNFLNN